jgi:hypothetical protein
MLTFNTPDTYFDSRPQELRLIGHKIFSFKETNPSDPKLKEVARQVTDEAAYTMGFTLPKVFSDKEIRWVTALVSPLLWPAELSAVL